MNEMNSTPINPQGFTNTSNIEGVFGTSMPNTFTRNVNNPNDQTSVAPVVPLGKPIAPPTGVGTQVTPTYDLNNY
tara:strand:+ start:4260 stop:4484 length:225 start_codon:yes stop_codon:yes gene_type:complete